METQTPSQPVKNDRSRRLPVVVVVALTAIVLAVYAYRQARLPDVHRVAQIWKSTDVDDANTDSVAALRNNGGRLLVLATAKWGDRIDVFDALTGRFMQHIGKSGDGPGEFRRPNGIAIARFDAQAPIADAGGPSALREMRDSSVVVVVEREGARAQLLSALDFKPVGIVGAGILKRPYGAAISYRDPSTYLYVTDSEVPPDKTVSVFRLARSADGVTGTLVAQFGDDGEGRILKAESIVVDDDLERVLLCDEDRSQHNVKVYGIDGKFTGRTFGDGIIVGDPEGIVIVNSTAGDFILVTDQRSKITIWHAFDRKTYAFITSFTGEPRIANTDGICIYPETFGDHPAGALFAVNDDADIRAYDLKAIINWVDHARSMQVDGD